MGWREEAPGLARAQGLVIRNALCWDCKAESGREGREGGGGFCSNQSINQATRQASKQPTNPSSQRQAVFGNEGKGGVGRWLQRAPGARLQPVRGAL